MKNAIKAMFHGKDVTEDEIKKVKEELVFINDELSKVVRLSSISYNEACEAFNKITFNPIDQKIVINNKSLSTIEPYELERPARVKCAYCDCVNNKDYGTCDFCGAPLKI